MIAVGIDVHKRKCTVATHCAGLDSLLYSADSIKETDT
jgi:hypothetical protein